MPRVPGRVISAVLRTLRAPNGSTGPATVVSANGVDAADGLSTREHALSLRPFAVYYGWPSFVNGADGDVEKAVTAFNGYDPVVFGDDTATQAGDPLAAPIMTGIAARGAAPYGYISIGVSHGEPNHSPGELRTRLESWCRLGAQGALLDCAGRDYGVSRARFNSVAQYAHSLGLWVLANAWDPDDILAGSSTLGPGDGYMGENDVLSDGEFRSPATYQPKLAKMTSYKTSLGISLYETATSADLRQANALAGQVLAALSGHWVDALQITDPMYSALDNILIPPPAALRGGND